MAKVRTRPFDPGEYVTTAADVAIYLKATFEDGDSIVIDSMLESIGRSKGMAEVTAATGLSFDEIDQALNPKRNPAFGEALKMFAVVGLRLTAAPMDLIGEHSGPMQGDELKAIRKGLGWTQAEMAEAMGLTPQAIGTMERGDAPIEKRTKLAAHYLRDHPEAGA